MGAILVASKGVAAGYAAVKGLTVAVVVLAVLHSGLSPFLQAILIALLSGGIGLLGIVAAAIINARSNVQLLDALRENKELSEKYQALAEVNAERLKDVQTKVTNGIEKNGEYSS